MEGACGVAAHFMAIVCSATGAAIGTRRFAILRCAVCLSFVPGANDCANAYFEAADDAVIGLAGLVVALAACYGALTLPTPMSNWCTGLLTAI
jgi:hypothetical protein